ncbi:MAG: ATP-binding protein [Gammaproteobacteria bacterium]|nr:ATP-binding protein [Gammaproteobacteria bacterium]
MKSIRTFLVIVLLATMTLIVFIAALRGYRSSMQQTELLFDGQLQDIAELLDELSIDTEAAINVPNEDTAEGTIAFQIWDYGVLRQRSANAPDSPIAPLEPGYRDTNFGGHRWRTLARQSGNAGRWIIVAERADIRFRLADDVILEAVMPIIFGLPVAGLLIWFVVGYGMKPLRRLATQLGDKASDDLTPLPKDQIPAELTQVVQSTNGLLTRLAASFEREKRFAADAAHELRTPISVLKVHLHNLKHDLPADNPNFAHLKDGVDRMNHLVEQILALYRTMPDQFMASFTRLDLHALARDVISNVYSEFAMKEQPIELLGSSSKMVGDRFALETLLQNLLSNAGKYTPNGGRVQITVQPNDCGVTLRVEDSGTGIAPDEYERVFERFYRVGGDRHASDQPGCGLGLAIVRHIAELHDARITLGPSSFESGLSVCIDFPSSTLLKNADHV